MNLEHISDAFKTKMDLKLSFSGINDFICLQIVCANNIPPRMYLNFSHES